MTNRRNGTNTDWLIWLYVLGTFVVLTIIVYLIETGPSGWNSRPTPTSRPVSSPRPSLESRGETLGTRVSILSTEVTYLQATAVVLDDSTPVPTATRTPRPISSTRSMTLIVTVEAGNVRTGPSTDYPSIDYVKQGQILNGPFSRENGWYRFCCVKENQHGWVHQSLVRVQNPTTPTSSARSATTINHIPITSPPASLGVPPIYKKYLDAAGVPILATADVSDRSMLEAYNILAGMMSTRRDLFDALVRTNFRIILYNHRTIALKDLPEFKEWPLAPHKTGGYMQNASESAAAAPANDSGCNTHLIHEIAHAIDYAEESLNSQFSTRRDKAYKNAMAAGLWEGQYAATDKFEYWAEAVLEWFSPRNKPLVQRDPKAAELVASVFGNAKLTSTLCPATALPRQ